jgi:hypothetical protein
VRLDRHRERTADTADRYDGVQTPEALDVFDDVPLGAT